MGNSAYPRLEISTGKIKHNTETLVRICRRYGIRVAGVSKVFCGNEAAVKAMVEGGIDSIADSRIENLKRYRELSLPKILLRLPMLSQVGEVIEFADISLNSEIETIQALAKEASLRGKIHQVILMFDLGDLREGIIDESEMLRVAQETVKLDGVRLVGIGTNLTCLGGIIPTRENLARLVAIKNTIERELKIRLEILSGGNSSSLHMVESGTMPEEINHLRLGESIVLGRETAYGRPIQGTFEDAFKLVAEVIEVKEKPSFPMGEIGRDAFGNIPDFIDKGLRIRAICAIGKQDIPLESIMPVDRNILIVGASSDHLILDVTDSGKSYRVGSLLSFRLTYNGILKGMSSKYVSKVIGQA
jgi:ornithine racemase